MYSSSPPRSSPPGLADPLPVIQLASLVSHQIYVPYAALRSHLFVKQ